MMRSEIGYEHYFLNYFLYLPFSHIQEEYVIKDTLKLMNEMGIKKFISKDDLNNFLMEVESLFDDLKNYCESETNFIKNKLNLKNKKRIDIIKEETSRDKNFKRFFKNHLQNFDVDDVLKENENFYDENNRIVSNIIYGDYMYNNENVEVYLHQRTMKKVRYKKRSYSILHPINKELIEKIIKQSDDLINEMNSINLNNISDKLQKEMKSLKEKF